MRDKPHNEYDAFDEALAQLQEISKEIHDLLHKETILTGEDLKQYSFLEEQFLGVNERFKKEAEKKFGNRDKQ